MPKPERHDTPSAAAYRCATVNGVCLPYLDEGRGAAVVCVHGAFADHRNWEPQRALIARHHRFIAYSQRYFGPWPWPDAGGGYSQKTHVADLAEFIRQLDCGPVYVVSRSYGATVALFAALRDPELMRALLVQEPQIKSIVIDQTEQKIMREEGAGLAEARNAHLANGRTIALHFAAPPGPRISCADLDALRVPLTITRGEFTRPYMRICAEAVHRCVAGSRLVVIPNARHAASEQNPTSFNEAILRFLAAH
jgi:pimeloyl-ACP methyl ester carboxylesterase